MKLYAFTGLSGAIGQRLLSQLPTDIQVLDLYHDHPQLPKENIMSVQCNLGDPSSLSTLCAEYHPTAIIQLAAITHIDRCEAEKGDTSGIVWKINVEGAQNLAWEASECNAYFLLMSTECVFHGSACANEKTPIDPKNWYGETKAAAESMVQRVYPGAGVLRSVVAFHENDGGKTIYGQIINALQRGETVRLVNDHFFSPTYTDDIVRAILKMVELRVSGIMHVASFPAITPYDFGCWVARKNGVDTSKIVPCSGVEYFGEKRDALRLKYSCLESEQSASVLGFHARSLADL